MVTLSSHRYRYASWPLPCVAFALFLTAGGWGQETPSWRFRLLPGTPSDGEWDGRSTKTTECRHAVVQFRAPTSPEDREKLERTGIRFLHYIPANAYIVVGPEHALSLLKKDERVMSATSIPPDAKIDASILRRLRSGERKAKPQALQSVKVLFFAPMSFENARKILGTHGAILEATRTSFDFRQTLDSVRLPADRVRSLAEEESVFLITEVDPPAEPANIDAQDTSNVDEIQPRGHAGYDLDGTGVTVGLWDAGRVRVTHEQIRGRATQEDQLAVEGFDNHSCHVAGIVAGNGTGNAEAEGMAPGATLLSWDTAHDLSEVDANADRISVSNHSYTYGVPSADAGSEEREVAASDFRGRYGSRAQAWDRIVLDRDLIVVRAAGNDQGESGYDTLISPAVAKNVITVGAIRDLTDEPPVPNDSSMTDFSSWGPTDDGRIKPDVVANGKKLLSMGPDADDAYFLYSGTSMSTPVVSGIAACLVQQFRRTFTGEDPTAATMKSVLIHTARDGGSQRGPDYRFGWGLVDARAAAEFIVEQGTGGNPILLDDYSESFLEYPMDYTGMGPIRVTLAWTDPPAVPISADQEDDAPSLVNDLDLHLFGPDGAHYPWTLDPHNPTFPARQDRENHRDNVEQILIESPVPGPYAIWIDGQVNLGSSQKFTLCVSGLRPGTETPRVVHAEIVSPASGEVISSDVAIRTHILDNLGTSRIVFKVDGIVIDEIGTDRIEGEIDITPPRTETTQTAYWDATAASNGSHIIEVIAISIDGRSCSRQNEVFVCHENEDVVSLTVDGLAEFEGIWPSGDEDWFSFETPLSATYTVESLRLPNSAEHPDTVLTLYGPDSLSTPVFVNDDGGDENLSSVTQVLEGNRVYHVKVSGYSGSTGFYRIRVRRAPENQPLPIVPLVVDGPTVWSEPVVGESEHLYTFKTGAFGIHSIEISQSPASESSSHRILLYNLEDEKNLVGSTRPGHPLRRALPANRTYLVKVVLPNTQTDRYSIGIETLEKVPPVYVRSDAAPGGNGLTWEGAFDSLGTALVVLRTTGEIWVAAGTYHESVKLEPDLAFYGGFLGTEESREERDWAANETVIDAAGLNSAAVFGADDAILDGFIITGGMKGGVRCDKSSPALTNCSIRSNLTQPGQDGGGVYCFESSPVLTNCTIHHNLGDFGGGVFCSGGSPVLIDCTIARNMASEGFGSGVYCSGSSPVLIDCTISRNTTQWYHGSGVHCIESSPTLTDCTISRNEGGGVYCSDSSPTLTNCTISENTSDDFFYYVGGMECRGESSPTLTNCTIVGNAGRGMECWDKSSVMLNNCVIARNTGGGVEFRNESTATLTNCTIARNAGSGVYCWDTPSVTLTHCTIVENARGGVSGSGEPSVVLTNCILWNPGRELLGSAVAMYCNIEGGRGEGNIDADPLFVDPENGDYRLRNGSPCIDTGLVSIAPSEDAEGRSRPGSDGLVDMGAYESAPEYEPDERPQSPDRVYVRSDAVPGGDGSSWEGAVTSIGAALKVIWATGEVWVAAGMYPESIELEPGVALYGGFSGIEQSREERDWAAHETIVDATGAGDTAVFGANRAILDGFTVTGAEYRGVYCQDGSSPTLANCTIRGNSGYYGVYCSRSSATLTNCTIAGNAGTGIYYYNAYPTLTNCTIVGNAGGGVSCGGDSSMTLTHCTIAGNAGGGVYSSSEPSVTLTNCILWNAGRELPGSAVATFCNIEGWRGEGNIDADPLFVDPANGDYHLRNGSPCIDSGLVSIAPSEDAEGQSRPGGDGLVDMGAYESPPAYEPGERPQSPSRVYVRSDAHPGGDGLSWEGAFNSIGDALQTIWADGEVWVAAGRYNESVEMETGVALYGGFSGSEESREERDWAAHETIVDATGFGSNAVFGADGAILDGFTATGGYIGVDCFESSPTLTNCTITGNTNWRGSGVYCISSSPVLTNCRITENAGGGVYCWDSSPTLTDCTITGNTGDYMGGGVYCDGESSPTLTHCTITGNTSEMGGGVYCDGESSPTLTHCIIANNVANYEGGGVSCRFGSSPILTQCTITGNVATWNGGGVSCYQSSPSLANCTITGNAAKYGGGVYCSGSSPSLTNCTIAGNTAERKGSGVYCSGSSPTLTNCILWNLGDEIDGVAVTAYSCIEDGRERDGSINADPLFVDPENGDYRLQEGSPCIDAGDPDAAFNDACLPPGLGTERCDMGAYGGPDNCAWLEPPPPVTVEEWLLY